VLCETEKKRWLTPCGRQSVVSRHGKGRLGKWGGQGFVTANLRLLNAHQKHLSTEITAGLAELAHRSIGDAVMARSRKTKGNTPSGTPEAGGMSRGRSRPDHTVLEYLRSLPEKRLHMEVVKPLLHEIATHVLLCAWPRRERQGLRVCDK